MANTARNERIDMRVNAETKLLAERAAAALGCASVTEYLTRLIHDSAPEVLQQRAAINLSNTQFDRFIAACQDENATPSRRILEAAERLDREGF
jgi:uncharacterized protein (DUF1778 family)